MLTAWKVSAEIDGRGDVYLLGQVKQQLDELTKVNQEVEEELKKTREQTRQAEDEVRSLEVRLESERRLAADLQAAMREDAKPAEVAQRLVALTEEVRVHKLALVQSRRQVGLLREEKRHLEAVTAQR